MMSPLPSVLLADGPDPLGPPELVQFGRFVGSWTLEVIWFNADGTVARRLPGEWHFGWILEGRAIADVWIVPPRPRRDPSAPPLGECGMTVRFYDAAAGAWRSTWHGPVNRVVMPFLARQIGDEMVLERSEDGAITRWVFSAVTPDSFLWRNLVSEDHGATWRLQQEMHARREADPR